MTRKKHADLVQYIINQWHQFDPQLDTSGTEIIGRIVRISSIVGRSVDKNLDRFQMTVGEFDVLAALAREKKQELMPKQLQDLILISSGGLTNRIDQLEKKGLIERSPNPNDRRSLLVKLTSTGLELLKEVAPTHLEIERQFIHALNEEEYAELRKLLGKILNHINVS